MLAHYDTLTRLPNRNYFRRRLTSVISSAPPDQFCRTAVPRSRQFQDRQRHAGAPARRPTAEGGRDADCAAAFAPKTAVCRLGGDEFTIILEHVGTVENVEQVAQKVRQRAVQPHRPRR